MNVSPALFEELVWTAFEDIPQAIRARLNNVVIEAKDAPDDDDLDAADYDDDVLPHDLFGLYIGVPLTRRTHAYEMITPDMIYIYRRAHMRKCHTLDQLRAEVKRTLRHEIAHHFGIDDHRLEELGAY